MHDRVRNTILYISKRLPELILPMAAAVMAAGCNTDGCTDNRSALPLMGLYSSATETPVTLDSIGIAGVDAPRDSMLVYPGKAVSSIYLPFRFDKDNTAFFFHYDYKEQGLDDAAFNDTITFYYTSEPYFASEECGAFFRYHIRKVDYTTHLIDEVEVTDSVITNVERERIKVYIRTDASDNGRNYATRKLKPTGGGRR